MRSRIEDDPMFVCRYEFDSLDEAVSHFSKRWRAKDVLFNREIADVAQAIHNRVQDGYMGRKFAAKVLAIINKEYWEIEVHMTETDPSAGPGNDTDASSCPTEQA